MSERKRLVERNGEVLFEFDGGTFRFQDCWRFGEYEEVIAGVSRYVMVTLDWTYVYLIVIADDSSSNFNGIRSGWYLANTITLEDAELLRSSWGLIHEQPPAPPSSWAGDVRKH